MKLNTFDDTGALIAAMTTSVPEEPCSVRNPAPDPALLIMAALIP